MTLFQAAKLCRELRLNDPGPAAAPRPEVVQHVVQRDVLEACVGDLLDYFSTQPQAGQSRGSLRSSTYVGISTMT